VVFDKDVAVQLRDGVTIHVDVFRPAGTEQVPVIVAWSPYGKGQGTSPSVMGVFGLVGLDNGIVSGLEKFEGAEQPPHLVAINPWEGVSDVYRDLVRRGGMPDTGFAQQLQEGSFFGRNRKEDILSEAASHPLVNDLWEHKIPEFDRITVPAYIVASYSNTLHTAGTFRAWRRIASAQKWLRIHNTQEWPDYYDERNVEDLRRFFDHYLRGEDNDWEQTPGSATRSSTSRAVTGSTSPPSSSPRRTSRRRRTTSTAARGR
jgi:predicted acyl esterase